MDTKSLPNNRIVIVLFVLSLLFRLLAWWVVPPPHLSTNATLSYLGGALAITEGEGFRDPAYPLFTPPLYALCIAASWQMFGKAQEPIIVSQILVDSLTTVVVYLIGVMIFGAMAGLICGVLLAAYPFSIYPTLYIGPETYFTFLFSLFVLLMILAFRRDDWRYFAGAGLTLGVATMMRGTTQFLPLFLVVLVPMFMPLRKRLVLGLVAFLVSFVLALLPWTVRNAIVLHSFIPVASGGIVFLWGSSPNFLEIDQRDKDFPDFLDSLRQKGINSPPASSGPVEKERFIFRAALENYKRQFDADPVGAARFLLVKLIRLTYSTESGKNHMLILVANIGIYVFAFLGVLQAWRGNIPLQWFFLTIFAYFILLHWATLPLFRYMVPIMPYVIAFAGYAAAVLYERRRVNVPNILGTMK